MVFYFQETYPFDKYFISLVDYSACLPFINIIDKGIDTRLGYPTVYYLHYKSPVFTR